MDIYQFIASLVGSLAWPSLVAILLWINRGRLKNLPEWLQEMSLPGGWKVIFRKENAEATLQADDLKEAGKPQVAAPIAREEQINKLVTERPDLAVLDVYRDIEGTIGEIRSRIPGFPTPSTSGPRFVLTELLKRHLIDGQAVSLYEHLRSARNAIAHGSSVGYPSMEEAKLFVRNARVLNSLLRGALETMKAELGEQN
jgi:hypothetical protein